MVSRWGGSLQILFIDSDWCLALPGSVAGCRGRLGEREAPWGSSDPAPCILGVCASRPYTSLSF